MIQTTINISLPMKMYQDAKKALAKRGYTSISEFIRNALRNELYLPVTENGFTSEFEEKVLKSAKEPIEKSTTWDGKTPFSDFVIKHSSSLNGKNNLHRRLSRRSSKSS